MTHTPTTTNGFPHRNREAINSNQTSALDRLLAIMDRLRDPDGGCPWDVEQSFETIAPYTIEEAYEVADAIERQDMADLRDELGDLLFQVVFHSQMAEEAGEFRFEDVADSISEKMLRRHPHVFAGADPRDAQAQIQAWEAVKAEERARSGKTDTSVLANLPTALPALLRAEKLSKRAARVGFDWPDLSSVFDKIEEEINEVKEAIEERDPDHIQEEIGDVLFAIANLARKLKIDPETALRGTNAKFDRRFRAIETRLSTQGSSVQEADLETMESLWLEVKTTE
ncbi:nucleoside triphosphate pyrophosphohydrolase [Oceanicaulis sp. UBA2681]|uniref:nucleoside triphosphate pyrophosphohydrolase n=1 Tax=Oceanicaulis sp. UBA2681 TaxID=1947007 RepID=UPI00257C10EE|nr:nucleoside triphosphate pyrophosphohydrolase [Oceanicaulis sp. UBA2681]|tara:strand:- start:2028 stop:2879 length:852 start_codon:yes stop_codon:yes gene_type:complete